jgi:hypothetical protein
MAAVEARAMRWSPAEPAATSFGARGSVSGRSRRSGSWPQATCLLTNLSRNGHRRSRRRWPSGESRLRAHAVYVFGLDGQWIRGTARHVGGPIMLEGCRVKGGMSGSPIIANSGAAVGVVSTGPINPGLARDLPGWLAPKAIRWWQDHDRYVRYPELKSFGVSTLASTLRPWKRTAGSPRGYTCPNG